MLRPLEAIGVAGGGVASGLVSVCSSLTSDLKIRIDLPSERAASGSFLAPNEQHEDGDND